LYYGACPSIRGRARYYDPTLGLFHGVDPLAHKYPSQSPYNYVENNPIKYIDPYGREKIIGFHSKNKNDAPLIAAAQKYQDDGAIHIFAHGSSKHVSIYVGDKKHVIRNAKDLDKFLMKNSETWKNKEKGDQNTIIFHSCNSGACNGDMPSFAQDISDSKLFENTKVVGGDAYVWSSSDGEKGVFPAVKDDKGSEKLDKNGARIRSDEPGNWNVFENGKQTEQYKGDWKPKEKPTFIDWLFKKKED
jgi:uncharacterized protein RhaS with RHS repeats